MKRHVFAFLMVLGSVIFAEPYKPYPILFVHGYGGSSKDFGVNPYKEIPDTICKDSIVDGETMDEIIPLMQPYAWVWYEWEKEQYPNEIPTYTPDTTVEEPSVKARYPNKIFLEVVNMDDLFDNGIHSGRINL